MFGKYAACEHIEQPVAIVASLRDFIKSAPGRAEKNSASTLQPFNASTF
jgi:hypothetical protein